MVTIGVGMLCTRTLLLAFKVGAVATLASCAPRETAPAPVPEHAPATSAPLPIVSAPAPTSTADAGTSADAATAAAVDPAASCDRPFEPAEPPDPPARWAPVALYEREPSTALSALCDKLIKRQRRADPESFFCYARRGTESQGVWAFLVEHPNPNRPEQYWRLAYAAPSGAISVASKKTVFSDVEVPAVAGGELPGLGELRAITDFDRNGSPEVVVRAGRPLDSSGTPGWEFTFWTVRGATIVPYAPAAKLRAAWMEDIDADGVPDVLIDPHGVQLGNTQYWWGARRDWSLGAHAKPDGTFSIDDAVAVGYARALCPTRPSFPSALQAGPECFAGVAHCARLWGIESSTIIDAITAACAAAGGDPMCDVNDRAWSSVATAKLPLKLE